MMSKEGVNWLSRELAVLNGLLRADGHEFLERIYPHVLSRPIDAAGLATYSEWIGMGRSRVEVICNLVTSPEYKRKVRGVKKLSQSRLPPRQFVREAYQKVFWRDPDPEGFEHYTSVALTPDAYAEILEVFVASDEGQSISARKILLKLLCKLHAKQTRYYTTHLRWVWLVLSRIHRWRGSGVVGEVYELLSRYGRPVGRGEAGDAILPTPSAVSAFDRHARQRVYTSWAGAGERLPEEIKLVCKQYLERESFPDLLEQADRQNIDVLKLYKESCNRRIVYSYFG